MNTTDLAVIDIPRYKNDQINQKRRERQKRIIAQNLLNLRLKNALTQEGLAHKTRLSKNTIYKLEAAKIYPHASTIYQLSKFFRVDSQQLLGNVEVDCE